MNVFDTIQQIYKATEAGKQLADPGTWAGRASLVLVLTSLINAVIPLANAFLGSRIDLGGVDVASIAQGLSVVGMLVANTIHVASNKSAGH